MSELTFDVRERDTGYSCVIKYDDKDICISLGTENAYNFEKPVAIVELKKLNLKVLGNEKLYDICEAFLKYDLTKVDFLNAVMKVALPAISYDKVFNVANHFYNTGKKDGREELQTELKRLLGVE